MMKESRKIVIGTRRSPLALRQTEIIRRALQKIWPDMEFETLTIVTDGDRITNLPLSLIGGKGLFTKALEDRMLDGTIDLAVHSLKDLPTALPEGLSIGAVPSREDPADVLLSRTTLQLDELPAGAVIGTSSVRRSSQLAMARPDLCIKDIRGNVDTRFRKLDEGQYDAIILAAAGLNRLGLSGRVVQRLDWYHAAGQGALAVETRAGDHKLMELLAPLNVTVTMQAVSAERAFLHGLGGGCHVPIGVRSRLEGSILVLEGMVASPDAARCRVGCERGLPGEAADIGERLARVLLGQGAADILESAQNERTQ
ncbi:MAG: hydroxymethylbilane synthase [Spirochaetia bacterium]|jgi:hydroxymethylbilane synthase|nr:hydroxymethylbilane synthase [Spirochaetia bacterium]